MDLESESAPGLPTTRGAVTGYRVAVLGLGYVGLPLVRACLRAGHTVVGFDVSEATVESLNGGKSHVDDVSRAEVEEWLGRGFLATSEPARLTDIDAFIICVPTPLSPSGSPDLAAIESASRIIAESLNAARPHPLVVLESTTYPGTTEEVVLPILEATGRRAGVDFALSFSPERIDPGNATWTFENTPKVVGGFTKACRAQAMQFYATITASVVPTRGLKEAELTKLLENTYRHVNIALVNELAMLCDELGIDVWDVIDAAATKPYGFQVFRPGPGVGGHCIPIDPNYLSHRVKSELGQPFRMVELAQEINASMPAFVISRAARNLSRRGQRLRGAAVLVLGVTYKKDIADMRESPAIPLVEGLVEEGAVVSFHDPYVEELFAENRRLPRVADLRSALEKSDLVILVQDHSAYAGIFHTMDVTRVLDTRGVVNG